MVTESRISIDLTTTTVASAQYGPICERVDNSPVVDYSRLYSSLMSGSLFTASNMKGFSTEGNKVYTYNNLLDKLGEGTASGDLESFLNKLRGMEWNGQWDKRDGLYPQCLRDCQKGIDLSDTSRWTDKDIFISPC